MMISLIKMNLLILFLLDLLLDKINLNNMSYVKNRQRINVYSMAYNKKARLVYEKKKKKSCEIIKMMHKRLVVLTPFSSFCSLSYE